MYRRFDAHPHATTQALCLFTGCDQRAEREQRCARAKICEQSSAATDGRQKVKLVSGRNLLQQTQAADSSADRHAESWSQFVALDESVGKSRKLLIQSCDGLPDRRRFNVNGLSAQGEVSKLRRNKNRDHGLACLRFIPALLDRSAFRHSVSMER